MKYYYNILEKNIRKVYRRFSPVPTSPYTTGHTDNICAINLVPPEKLEKFFNQAIKELRKIRGNNVGDYLEFGVFNGSSLSSMYHAAQKSGLPKVKLYGFDAFEGLPKESENEDDGVWKQGFYSCSFEQTQQCLKEWNVDLEKVAWVKGWYKDTLTSQTIEKYNLNAPGIIFIDCDTYSSSKSVLDFVGPLLTKPAILCFDDWKLNNLDIKGMGEYKAFNEFLESNPQFKTREIKSYNRKSRSFILFP